jgi:hypothetical protein
VNRRSVSGKDLLRVIQETHARSEGHGHVNGLVYKIGFC